MADGSAKPLVWAGVAAGLLALAIAVATLFVRNAPAPDPTPPAATSPSVAPAAATAPPVQPPLAVTEPATPAPAAAARTPDGLGPLTSERLAASEEWLKRTPGNRYFIQLMNVEAGAATEIEAFLSTHAGALDAQQLRVYRSRLSGRDRIGVIYGEFTTREQASAAISQLPATVRATYPYVRSVYKLR